MALYMNREKFGALLFKKNITFFFLNYIQITYKNK